MGLRTDRDTIDGVDVVSTQLPPLRAFALMADLGKLLGPALGDALGDGLDMTADVATLAGPLAKLLGELSDRDSAALIRECLVSTEVIIDGKRVELTSENAINDAFAGRLMLMIKVIVFAIRTNFSSFFADATKLASDQGGVAESQASE